MTREWKELTQRGSMGRGGEKPYTLLSPLFSKVTYYLWVIIPLSCWLST